MNNIQYISTDKLKAHPRNNDFFDNIYGDKWHDFLESIRTSGIIEPIVATQNYVVISGHQRLRAAKELKLLEVPVIVKNYKSEQDELKDLIETNLRQRGTISASDIKSGAIVKALEDIYKKDKKNDTPKNQQELADKLGISLRNLQYLKKLNELPDELREIIETDKVTTSTALRVVDKLSDKERNEVIQMIQDSDKKVTGSEIEKYVEQLRQKNIQIAELKSQLKMQTEQVGKETQKNFEIIKKATDDYLNQLNAILAEYIIDDIIDDKIIESELKLLRQNLYVINDKNEAFIKRISGLLIGL